MKKTLVIIFLLLSLPNYIFAVTPNNKFGMFLAQPNTDQFLQVKEMVNFNGGDWGYVTLIIEEKDRNKEKWQGTFDQLRKLHLIPIIRLATSAEGENWRRPEIQDVQGWADFLDSLNWVTKNRYITLFNEPNHGSEWGGEVDAKNYGEVATEFAKKLKEKNGDFFVMLAGFDASAPSWMPGMEDEEIFIKGLINQAPTIFDYVDGWSSHSYPNPGFSGSPYANGRGSIRTYEWELGLLNSLGINKELPVFITETGWKRGGENIVAENFQITFDQIWLPDSRVVAVTPFVFDYQGEPFLEFSWKKLNSQEYYQQYSTVQAMSKIKGEPDQIEKGWINLKLPMDLVVQSTYHFKVKLENLGQTIWDKDFGYKIKLDEIGLNQMESDSIIVDDLKNIIPFEEKDVYFTLKTDESLKNKKIKFILQKNDKNILTSEDWNINILPLPSLKFETRFFPWGKGRGDNYEIQIFDVDDQLVFKKKNLSVNKGLGYLQDIQNIALDELYRVVLLKPYHLPRQEFIVFKREGNIIKFKPLLPFDLNNDGTFNFKDITYIFKKPGK
jgi:hypothetical protein